MLRQMPNRETNPSNPQNQPERRRNDRRQERQPEGWPSDERRKEQRRENIQMAEGGRTGGNGQMAQGREGTTPEKAEQKGEGHTPKQQTVPAEPHEHKSGHGQNGEGTTRYSNPSSGKEFGPGGRERSFGPQNPQKREERESGNFGVSYDRGFGQNPGEQGRRRKNR